MKTLKKILKNIIIQLIVIFVIIWLFLEWRANLEFWKHVRFSGILAISAWWFLWLCFRDEGDHDI